MSDILFVCVHNAGRSQMAAALFNRMAAERGMSIRAASAGTHPAAAVHSGVAAAMRVCGINISDAKPALMTNALVERANRVITMGCAVDAAECPALLLKTPLDWGLPDPAGKDAAEVRAIRDEIRRRVAALIDALASDGLGDCAADA